jgi:hypothetical protein
MFHTLSQTLIYILTLHLAWIIAEKFQRVSGGENRPLLEEGTSDASAWWGSETGYDVLCLGNQNQMVQMTSGTLHPESSRHLHEHLP